MKTTEILLKVDDGSSRETNIKVVAGKGLKYLLFLFMLSSLSFLPSCAVELRTPQPGVSIENHNGYHHHLGNRHSRNEHVDVDIHNR
ncbi:MAG: hypothetical protein WCR72_00455 [Bacteroidota bacterium]